MIKTWDDAQAWHVAEGLTHQVDCSGGAGISFSPVAEIATLKCAENSQDEEPYHMIWDLRSGNSFRLGEVPGDYLQLKFSPDGQLLIGRSEAGEISIWDAGTGELLFTLPTAFPTAIDTHFVGDGRLVAILLEDGSLEFYAVK